MTRSGERPAADRESARSATLWREVGRPAGAWVGGGTLAAPWASVPEGALQPSFGGAVESGFADLIGSLRQAVARLVDEIELLRVALAPGAEAAVQAQPHTHAERERMIAFLRGQPRDFSASRRDPPNQIRHFGFEPVGRFLVVR